MSLESQPDSSTAPAPTASSPPASAAPERTPIAWTLLAVLGGMLAMGGLCAGTVYWFYPLFEKNSDLALATNLLLCSLAALGLVVGGLLAAQGLKYRAGARGFSLPRAWIFAGAFFLALALGQGFLLAKLGAAWLFPPWHVIAAGMIPLAVLAYAARELAPVSRRSVVAQLAWGAVGTILPAMLIELAALVVLLVLAFWVMLIINPASLGQIRQLAETLTNTRSAGDPTEMLQVLIQNPPIAIASGLLVVGLVPLIEETFKGLGVAVFARSAPRASTALLWGLAAGAGFALTENLFNGSALTDLWAIGMLARGGTSLVHIAATGTVAVAWYAARVEHRYVRFALLFGIAVLAHTLWNLLTISLVGVSFFSAPAGNPLTLTLGELAALGFGLGLFALVVGGVVWIVVLVRWGMRWDRMGDQAIRNQAISDQESVTR